MPVSTDATVLGVSTMFDGDEGDVEFSVSADNVVSIVDTLRGMETRVYKLSTKDQGQDQDQDQADDDNLVYNPSFEQNVNPGVTDGFYLGAPPNSERSFFFADSRLSHSGITSMRLETQQDAGLTFAAYTIGGWGGGLDAKYTFKIWAKGAGGGETVAFNLQPLIFVDEVTTLTVDVTEEWAEYTIEVTTGDTSVSCPYGCRGWLNYGMTSNGTVWLDDMRMSMVAA